MEGLSQQAMTACISRVVPVTYFNGVGNTWKNLLRQTPKDRVLTDSPLGNEILARIRKSKLGAIENISRGSN